MDVRDKVTIVTGASGGIGNATARLFARNGAKVALVARNATELERTVNDLRELGYEATAFPADVSQKGEVEHMVSEVYATYGRIDILINNAGQGIAGAVAMVNNDNFHKIVELNLFGPLYGIQAVVPKMREHGGGLIINISSMVTKLRIPGIGGYAATKAALNMLSHTARLELAPDNIRVVTVYPGMVATDFGKNILNAGADRDYAERGATPEMIAEKILVAAHTEPRDLTVTRGLRAIGFLSTLAPKVVDTLLLRGMRRQQSPTD